MTTNVNNPEQKKRIYKDTRLAIKHMMKTQLINTFKIRTLTKYVDQASTHSIYRNAILKLLDEGLITNDNPMLQGAHRYRIINREKW